MADADAQVYSLGSWLRRGRKALDLTRAANAARVGCAEITIRKLEADLARPSRQIAERLALCLGLSPDEHTLFLQVARGQRSVDHLPAPLRPIDPTPLHTAYVYTRRRVGGRRSREGTLSLAWVSPCVSPYTAQRA